MKGNRKTGKSKAESGRLGRGASALEARESRQWKTILKRIDRIVARAERAGTLFTTREALTLPVTGRKL